MKIAVFQEKHVIMSCLFITYLLMAFSRQADHEAKYIIYEGALLSQFTLCFLCHLPVSLITVGTFI